MGSDTRSQQYIPSSDFFNSHRRLHLLTFNASMREKD
jgi:hypothetical protein